MANKSNMNTRDAKTQKRLVEMANTVVVPVEQIEPRILRIRGQRVIL